MPTIVTGAAGFIGAKIAYELMKSDYVAIGDGDSFTIKQTYEHR